MSIKINDLSQVEVKESTGGTMLPVGRFVCRIVEAEEGKASTGTPSMMVTLECVEGEHKGRSIKDWWYFTERTVEMTKRKLLALGMEIPEGDFELSPPDLIGRPVQISVQEEDYNGERRRRVKFYDPAPHLEHEPRTPAASAPDVDVPF